MATSQINSLLGAFGLNCPHVDIVPSKRTYVMNLLSGARDEVILEIAHELQIEIPGTKTASAGGFRSYLDAGGTEACVSDFNRALAAVATDPDQAIASASSTLESVCKQILDVRQHAYPRDESLNPLLKATFKALDLSPDGRADPVVKQVLGGLFNAAVGLGVLRTKFSAAHGRGASQSRLLERHARLAVNAASTVGHFLLETCEARRSHSG